MRQRNNPIRKSGMTFERWAHPRQTCTGQVGVMRGGVTTWESHVEVILRKMKSCTCTLDPIPTDLLKSHIPTLSPFITKVVNLSLQSGYVPPALKVAVIRPLLKDRKS